MTNDVRTDTDGSSESSIKGTVLWVAIPVTFALAGGVVTGRWAEVAVAIGAYFGIVVLWSLVRVTDEAVDRIGGVLDR